MTAWRSIGIVIACLPWGCSRQAPQPPAAQLPAEIGVTSNKPPGNGAEAVTANQVADQPVMIAALTAADTMVGSETGQTRDDNALKMTLVWCPPGAKELKHGFWIGKFEVTQGEWTSLMDDEPWNRGGNVKESQDDIRRGPDFPASRVDWNEATTFCRTFTKRERAAGRLPDDWEYILPTDAQWERACRAGSDTAFSFGDDGSKLNDYGWWGHFRGDGSAFTESYAHQVGQKLPNRWGIYDMHGNVAEWCLSENTRGGCFTSGSRSDCECSRGVPLEPDRKTFSIGFRVSLSQKD